MEYLEEIEIFNGIEKSFENSAELIDEAKILISHNKLPRAFALIQFSIEELGKASLLNRLWLSIAMNEKVDYSEIKKEFFSHKKKTKSALGIDMMLYLVMEKSIRSDFKWLKDAAFKQLENIDKINSTKNKSLYVFIENKKFSRPSEAIGKDLVNDYLLWAEVRYKVSTQIYNAFRTNKEAVIEEMKKTKIGGKEQETINSLIKELQE